jgi:rod shape-determining protein MreC
VENIVIKILTPVSRAFYGLGGKIENFGEGKVSLADYSKLEAERNELAAKNAELQILGQENEELRKALDFRNEIGYNLLPANVVGRDPVLSNYLVIDKGEHDGVRENYPVVSPEGILVGKIIRVQKKASLFVVPTDTDFQTAAAILGKSKRNTTGLARGEKGLGISMEFIPQDESVEKDDIVITSGLELNMPKGLIIGRIAEVQKEARDIFSKAAVSPPLSYDNLSIVMVKMPQ